MTQQEFETLTGKKVSTDSFDFANRVYMAAGEMDKNAFCKDYFSKKIYESNIVCYLTKEVENLSAAKHKLNHEIKDIEASREGVIDDFAYTLIEIAAGTKDLETRAKAREKAIKLIGIKEYIRRRIELCCELDKEDLIALRDDILK